MSKVICNECETVAHCMKNGCIPKQPAPVAKPHEQEPLGKVNELFDEAVIEQCGFDRELLVYTSPPAQREPLTDEPVRIYDYVWPQRDEHKEECVYACSYTPGHHLARGELLAVVHPSQLKNAYLQRDAEAAHGIKGGA